MPLRLLSLARNPLAVALFAALALATLSSRDAFATFPPAGSETLPVTGDVTITSRIGTETVALTGTATFLRSAEYLESGVEVQDAEITALSLTGNSVTGPVTVTESSTLASTGELRSLQASPQTYPASSFFDVYAVATIPASPNPTITAHNNAPLHLTTTDLTRWPPFGAVYTANPNPCVPLVPALPKQVCVTGMSFTVSGGVGGITELPVLDVASESDTTSRHDIAKGAGIAFSGMLAAAGIALVARRMLRAQR